MIRWLLEGLLTGGLLAAAVWTLCLWPGGGGGVGDKRRRFGPAVRHALWMLVLVKLLLPPLLAWPWALRDAPPNTAADASPSGMVQQARWWLTSDDQRPHALPGHAPDRAPRAATAADGSSGQSSGAAPSVGGSGEAAGVIAAASGPWLTPARLRAGLLTVWMAGGALYLGLQILRTLRLRRLVLRAVPDHGLPDEVNVMAAESGLRPLRACRIAGIDGPYVWACLRPVLLWPADMNHHDAAARGLIAHELAHVRRGDHWVGWLELLAGSIWWWNPVYWLACRQLHRYAELCCDAWAVRYMPGERRTYAAALLSVCQRAASRRTPALALGVRGPRRELEGRLTMIMKGNPELRPGVTAWALAAFLLALSVPGWSQTTPYAPLPFTLSKETTVVTEPLLADGTPDYMAALNQEASRGVTPANNGFVALVETLNFPLDDPRNAGYARMLELAGAKQPSTPVAWPLYQEFLIKEKKLDPDKAASEDDKMYDLARGPWSGQEYPDLVEYLTRSQAKLDQCVAAAERPQWWIPYVSQHGQLNVNAELPLLGRSRYVADMLCVRGMLRVQNGDIAGATRDLLAVKRLGRHLGISRTIYENLVGCALDALANTGLGAMAASGRMTQADSAALLKTLAALPPAQDPVKASQISVRYGALRIMTFVANGQLDEIRHVFDDWKAGNPPMSEDLVKAETADMNHEIAAFASINLDQVDWDAALRELNAQVDALEDIARAPSLRDVQRLDELHARALDQWKAQAETTRDDNAAVITLAKQPEETRAAYAQRIAHDVASRTLQSPGKAVVLFRRSVMSQDMVRILLAAAAFKDRTGNWPDHASDLVPAYLPSIPLDPHSAADAGTEPLLYKLTPNGPRVYSAGVSTGTAHRDFGIGAN